MKVYMVASALPTWMRTGYGHSLLAADATDILVSFVDFMKPGNPHSLTIASMPPYVIDLDSEVKATTRYFDGQHMHETMPAGWEVMPNVNNLPAPLTGVYGIRKIGL